MRPSRLGTLLVAGCLSVAVGAGAQAAAAQAATASILPARSAAVVQHHRGYSTLSALALLNVSRGTEVTVSAATDEGAPVEEEGSVTASRSGYVDLTALVGDLRFRAGAVVSMGITYVPPGSVGERYSKTIVVTFSASGIRSTRNTCSQTFAGQTTTGCQLPCPAPAGISVDYCDGLGFAVHFHSEFPYVSARRSVRLSDLRLDILNLGSSVAVLCKPGRGSACPPLEVHPNLRRHHLRLTGPLHRPLTPGTSIEIVLYKGNFTGQTVLLDVVSSNRAVINSRRLCTYADASRPQRCTRTES